MRTGSGTRHQSRLLLGHPRGLPERGTHLSPVELQGLEGVHGDEDVPHVGLEAGRENDEGRAARGEPSRAEPRAPRPHSRRSAAAGSGPAARPAAPPRPAPPAPPGPPPPRPRAAPPAAPCHPLPARPAARPASPQPRPETARRGGARFERGAAAAGPGQVTGGRASGGGARRGPVVRCCALRCGAVHCGAVRSPPCPAEGRAWPPRERQHGARTAGGRGSSKAGRRAEGDDKGSPCGHAGVSSGRRELE